MPVWTDACTPNAESAVARIGLRRQPAMDTSSHQDGPAFVLLRGGCRYGSRRSNGVRVGTELRKLVVFTRDWGFSLSDIGVPIRFWHGDADNIVPLAHAQHVAALVPDAELRVRAGESHLGALDAAEEIFGALLEFWRART